MSCVLSSKKDIFSLIEFYIYIYIFGGGDINVNLKYTYVSRRNAENLGTPKWKKKNLCNTFLSSKKILLDKSNVPTDGIIYIYIYMQRRKRPL